MMQTPDQNAIAASDDAIVKRVQSGDKNAFNILVLRYQHKVYDVAYRYVRDHGDASDLSQEVFIRAYKSIGSFRGDSSFYTWLYRIATNVSKTFLEQNQRHKYNVDIDDPEMLTQQDSRGLLIYHESPDSVIETQELKEVILKAMQELPDDLRRAVYLREVEGMGYEDIAKIMDTPLGTVRSRIFRGRQYIEERMEKFSKGL